MSLAPIYFAKEIREIEARANISPGEPVLMERAGLAAAREARSLLGERGRRILVVAGPGNNGGDAFEVAAHLKYGFFRVDVAFLGEERKLPLDAARALGKWRDAGGIERSTLPDAKSIARNYDLVVDGLFGIGLTRPLEGRYANAVKAINQSRVPVLALDIATGIDGDTGAIQGCAVRATRTLSFIALKPGLLTLDGPDYCGEMSVDTLGLDVEVLQAATGHLLDPRILGEALTPRPRNFHKGNAGDVAILGGARGMVGAALLAGRTAIICGAGRVHLGLMDEDAPRVDPERPELMLRSAQDLSFDATVVAAGPGMGQDDIARALLSTAIGTHGALILDADALNLVAFDKGLARAVAARSNATLLTPHPAEAGRLLATTTREVQANRVGAALDIARRFNATVALKGNGTVVAAADGRWWINSSGHPGMAGAGMGDALTGMAASLVAQGAQAVNGLCAAVWLHGAAGDALAVRHGGPLGTLAGDIGNEARLILNRHLAAAS
jgi:hydroxyethylthiazole kinase-like uncharacterized protein yjeF